jgi:hypothetical protein
LKLSNVDLLIDISKIWMDIKKLDQAKDALEMALKARSTNKDA